MPVDKKWMNATYLAALKKGVEDGILLKSKASYKLSAEGKKTTKAAAKPKKEAAAPKTKKSAPKKAAPKKKSAPKKKAASEKTAVSNISSYI
jgi:histone H1/5